jgi:hypothetical protein
VKGSNRDGRWLILIHQIPPRPAYLRVKIARRLGRTGAVAIKNTVYVLPQNDQAQEDFQWVLREIVQGGGEATVAEARFVEGIRDRDLEDLFNRARNADYQAIARDARKKTDPLRLRKRLDEVAAIDFFGAPGREAAEGLVLALERREEPADPPGSETVMRKPRGATWVTRKDVHVDRLASAWLIRRFIDSKAKLKFVPGKEYAPKKGELRFDMFDGEFTHQDDLCTFEVLLQRFGLHDPALAPIGEIVHDIDLKDSRYARPERDGIARMIEAICAGHARDEERLARAAAIFDDLHTLFSRGSRK